MAPAGYFRPRDLGAALDLMRRPGMRPVAGATDLFPATQSRELPGSVVDLTAIPGLRGITRDERGIRFGATTTWTDIVRAPLPPAFDGLKQAAREIGSVQIQNAGTVAGNLCNASPAADGTPCWLTLDAEVEIASADGIRTLSVADFVTGPRQTALEPGEIVTAILVPVRAADGVSAFLKLGARRYLVISIVMAAARIVIEDGRIRHAAVAVGACSPVARRLPELEAALLGAVAADAASIVSGTLVDRHLSPIGDVRADAAYRAEAASELVRRVLMQVMPQHASEAA